MVCFSQPINITNIEVNKNKKDEEINRMFNGLEDQDDSCSKNNITISNSLSNMKQVDVGEVDDDYDLGI